MAHSKRDILEEYSTFLECNLVLTDGLLSWLKAARVISDAAFAEIQALPRSIEKNKTFLSNIFDGGDLGFKKLVEGLIANGQPFIGELLENEDKRLSEPTDDVSERVAINDEMLKRCPGVDKLRADTRDKMKTYLQEQLLRAYLRDTSRGHKQGKSVEMINLKRQNYETQRRLSVSVEGNRQEVDGLKDALREEQLTRQEKEDAIKDLRNELVRVRAEYEQKWSSQIKMVDANTRSVFKMHDKMAMLTDWLTSLDGILNTSILQSGIDSDSLDQLENKLKRYTSEIEALRHRGIGTDKLKDELYDAVYTSRYLPIEDRKNKAFYDLLLRLYGSNQVTELATICTKDVLEAKHDREHASELKWRDEKIEGLTRGNGELNVEIERLKMLLEAGKRVPWRPVPASIPVVARDPGRNRQVLKPASVQPGSKPGGS